MKRPKAQSWAATRLFHPLKSGRDLCRVASCLFRGAVDRETATTVNQETGKEVAAVIDKRDARRVYCM